MLCCGIVQQLTALTQMLGSCPMIFGDLCHCNAAMLEEIDGQRMVIARLPGTAGVAVPPTHRGAILHVVRRITLIGLVVNAKYV